MMAPPPPTRRTATTVWGPHGRAMSKKPATTHASTPKPDANPHSETTLHRYRSPLVPEGPPYRWIHRQRGGKGHKERDQRGNASDHTHGFLLRMESLATTSPGTPRATYDPSRGEALVGVHSRGLALCRAAELSLRSATVSSARSRRGTTRLRRRRHAVRVVTTLGSFPCLVSGEGRPLVFLAGLLPKTGVASWQKMHWATAMPYTARRLVHYVNRRPDLPPGITFAQLAAEHAQAIRSSFDGPVDLLGLSTGGSLAQQVAADHPEVVSRLALLSTGYRLSDQTRAQMRRIAARIRAGAPRRAMALAASEMVPDGPWRLPAALAAAAVSRPALSHNDLADLATTIEAEDNFDLRACAASIQAPTLVISGGRDRFYPMALIEQTAALIPSSRLVIEPEHGHMTVTGVPAVHEAILNHLDGG
jgi:pimeloyl-ACP methyl ester carboxylesterase